MTPKTSAWQTCPKTPRHTVIVDGLIVGRVCPEHAEAAKRVGWHVH